MVGKKAKEDREHFEVTATHVLPVGAEVGSYAE